MSFERMELPPPPPQLPLLTGSRQTQPAELDQKRTRRRVIVVGGEEDSLRFKGHARTHKRVPVGSLLVSKRENNKNNKPARIRRTINLAILLIVFLAQSLQDNINRQGQRPAGSAGWQVLAFNLDTQSAIIHRGPEGSYFGYTVAQYKDRGVPYLLVGAPKAQTNQRGVREGGAVYKCSTSLAGSYQQIPFDQTGQNEVKIGNETRQSGDKSHQWFGASLFAAGDNGSIVACAPLYVHFSTTFRRRDPIGVCYVSRGSFEGFLNYSPCRLDDQWGHHHMGSCQAGFSSVITKDGGRLFMGAPGSHVWQGQAFGHNLRTDLSLATSAVNPHSEDDSYLGYSLSLGKFGGSTTSGGASVPDPDLAIGIPRDNQLAGKVMLVDKDMRTMRNITGEQMGAYFGYALATVDVNGDDLDDLLIGAPLYFNQTISHKEPHFERGRVYVALQNSRHEFSLSQRLDGHKNKARFGSSLANCGDLNKDGFQDVAVGAPYDGPEQRGAVYIYLGHKEGLSEEYDQVIYAEQLPRGEGSFMRSFGFSLSAGRDLDGNGFPDLLVGDYAANRAILLKTRPVIYVTSSVTFSPEHFNLDEKRCVVPNTNLKVSCINVKYCTKYRGVNVDNSTSFVYDIKLDSENKGAPRLFFLNPSQANSQPGQLKNEEHNSSFLIKDQEQCNSFKAYISPDIRDKLTPLKIDIDYNLAQLADPIDPQTGQLRLRPVLNRSQANKIQKVAMIQKNCGPDNVCEPDLRVTMSSNIRQYLVGSNERIVLDVSVKNLGEDAFESMFYLTMPMTINFIRINKTRADYPACYDSKPDQTGLNILTCDLGNPQQRNELVKFSVITEPARSNQISGVSSFDFLATVNSTNPEQVRLREDNTFALDIPIKVETELVLSGNSQPALVVHNSTEALQVVPLQRGLMSETDLGEEVYHTYQLQNRGPSTISDIALTILWPTKTKNGEYLLYLVEEPLVSEKVRCKPSLEMPINPLGLKYERGNRPAARPLLLQASRPGELATLSSSGRTYSARFKRQEPTAAAGSGEPALTSTVDSSILQQMNLKSCGPTQCNRFECNVVDLGHNEIATIKIRSRLYEQTLNLISMREFDISSKLVAQIKALPFNVSTAAMPPYVYEVKTQVRTVGLAVQDLLPWWLVVLAILLGITLFILLACFLKYLGFFARKRPPKSAEREPLTPTVWNDYQYSPGDTAL